MGLSIRAYARHRGVSHVAVKKAIDTGRITPLPDGTIDPVRADAEWARNTETTPKGSTRGPVKTRVAEDVREGLGAQMPAGGTTLVQARTINEVVKAQTNKVRLAKLKGELVDRASAIAHVFRLARAEREAWLNWPNRVVPQMAARLGVDEHTLHVVLDAAVREHLMELGEIQPKVDG